MESLNSDWTWKRVFAVFEDPDVKERYQALDAHLAGDGAKIEQHRHRLQAIFMPGLSEGMVDAYKLFDHIEMQYKQAIAEGNKNIKIYYSSTDGRGMGTMGQPGAAWNGGDWVVEELTKRRTIPPDALRGTETATDPTQFRGLHTRGETDAFVDAAKRDGITSAIIATSPWHDVRHISCLIASMAKSGHTIEAYYARPPLSLPEGETPDTFQLDGSQGAKRQTLTEELKDELTRVEAYWKKGTATTMAWKDAYGAPPAIIDQYLKHRDAGTLHKDGKGSWKEYMLHAWGAVV